MKRLSPTHLTLCLTLAGYAAVFAAPATAGQAARDRGPAPSAAALAACVGHKQGDRVLVKTAKGKTLHGTCRSYQGKLAARTHIRHKKDKGWWQKVTAWL
jgi:hypothetical protein